MAEKKLVRLNKLIADRGLCSRRAADKLIEEGRVIVNGKKVFELGTQVEPHKDRVSVDGKPLRSAFEKVYIMMNKPKGVLTTMDDPHERPTVKIFLEDVPTRVFPVGRLDWDSEGLLLFTNDGDFANKVSNPHSEVTKTYLVKIDGQPRPDQLQKLIDGVSIVGGRVSAKYIEKIEKGRDQYAWLKIVITEGKNRQIRQMFAKIGFDVLKLQRVAIGRLRLGQLERGHKVFLNEAAAQRVFLADLPDEVSVKKTYAGRKPSAKRTPKAASKKPKRAYNNNVKV